MAVVRPWDNFTNPHISYEQAVRWIDKGGLHGPDRKPFWITFQNNTVGLLQLNDVLDDTAMFDIRINTQYRRMGFGRQALKWLTGYTFENYPAIRRIEANTRADNVGMRRVLRACGYVKEAHYREGWNTVDRPDQWVDGVAYTILGRDWFNHTTTPVHWDDEL